MLFTYTLGEPSTEGLDGNHGPCPEHKSPSLVAGGIFIPPIRPIIRTLRYVSFFTHIQHPIKKVVIILRE